MSGAKDLSYDSHVQGAGMLDAGRSVDLAAELGGVQATPSIWSAGDFRGTSREGFANLMSPDDIELFRDAAKALERPDQSPEMKAAVDKFNQLIEDIANKRLDRTEAFRKMETIERELFKGAEADAKELEEALKDAAEELKKSDWQGSASRSRRRTSSRRMRLKRSRRRRSANRRSGAEPRSRRRRRSKESLAA
jgi:hypothetical protein